MLNYETLLSSYDDKLTLMQWLKKVEEALKDASAVAFKVNQRGNATLTFSVEFEDGSELETGPIVLQQGESVASAAIVGGHLKLTLTNGDVLDAGDLGGVSSFSIDASQHLIVHYQSGTTQDLGAIFSGNVVINGNFEVTGLATLPRIEGDENGDINVDGDLIISDGGVSVTDGAVSTPILTSQNDHIEAEKPVIEVMTGYSLNSTGGQFSPDYVGISKNGNKLSIAFNGVVTTQAAHPDGGYALVRFNMPISIGNKIIPHFETLLSNINISVLEGNNQWATPTTGIVRCVKFSAYQLQFYLLASNLNVSSSYYIRVETTFLLSDNLAA